MSQKIFTPEQFAEALGKKLSVRTIIRHGKKGLLPSKYTFTQLPGKRGKCIITVNA